MQKLIEQLQASLDQTAAVTFELQDVIRADLKSKIPYEVLVHWDTYIFFNVLILDVADVDRGVVEAFFEAYKIEGIDLQVFIKSPEITEKYYSVYRGK